MHKIVTYCQLVVVSLFLVSAAAGQTSEVDPQHAEKMKAGLKLFKDSVRSTLESHCLKCHNRRSKKADFDLSTRKSLMSSGHVGNSAREYDGPRR